MIDWFLLLLISTSVKIKKECHAIDIAMNKKPPVTKLRNVVADSLRGTCPCCGTTVKALFIHFNLRMRMCVNVYCEYPFNDDVVYEKVDPDLASDEEFDVDKVVELPNREPPVATPPVATPPVATPPVATPPVATPLVATPPVATPPVATAPVVTPPVATTSVATTQKICKKKGKKCRTKGEEGDEYIEGNVQQIKEMNEELFKFEPEIKTEELESMYRVQDKTGIKLLKDDELEKLKKEKGVNEPEELKFNIATNNDSIKIEIKIEEKEADPMEVE